MGSFFTELGFAYGVLRWVYNTRHRVDDDGKRLIKNQREKHFSRDGSPFSSGGHSKIAFFSRTLVAILPPPPPQVTAVLLRRGGTGKIAFFSRTLVTILPPPHTHAAVCVKLRP